MKRNIVYPVFLLSVALLWPVAAAEKQEATAAPTAEPAPATTGQPVIAVFPFQSRPKIDTRASVALSKRLRKTLDATGKFTFTERSAMANLGSELEFTRKGYIKAKSAAEWGTNNGANYVVTGLVVAAGKGHGGMGVGGVRISSKAIALAVDVQLIDCGSGAVLIEDTFKEEKTGLGLALGTVEFDPESRRGSEMVASVLRKLSRDLLTTLDPPKVSAVDEAGQLVTLAYGTAVFAAGDRWELFAAEKAVADPEAATQNPRKPQKLGAVRISEVQEGGATATLVDGSAEVGAVARFDKAGKKKKEKK
jgi:curli biogenesis system outer membrane secretion channel CsgG